MAHDDTKLVHTGRKPQDNFGVVNPPLYRASTILHPTLESWEGRKDGKNVHKTGHREVVYGLMGTPTQFSLMDALTALENGHDTLLVPSGMAACGICFLALAEPGAHFLVPDNNYLPVRNLANGHLKRIGCETTFYNPTITEQEMAALIRPETKLVWTESPGSLTFEMPDLRGIVAAARAKGVLTGTDNTYGAGYYLKPIDLGIDFSAHALTKYPCGGSDTMLGSVTTRTREQFDLIQDTYFAMGYSVSPDDAYTVQRGLRSMPTRLRQHYQNGLKVAEWLMDQPAVTRVLHPAMPHDPGHEIWKRDFTGANGLFAIIVDAPDRNRLKAMVENLELFGIGASWGGYESLITTAYPDKIRTAVPWTEEGQLLRIHVGLEDPDDLIADLKAGFDRLAGR